MHWLGWRNWKRIKEREVAQDEILRKMQWNNFKEDVRQAIVELKREGKILKEESE